MHATIDGGNFNGKFTKRCSIQCVFRYWYFISVRCRLQIRQAPDSTIDVEGWKKNMNTEVSAAFENSFVFEVPRKKKRRQKFLKLRGEVADCGVSEN